MNNLSLTWLGQSGFVFEVGEVSFACDLYLSDYCRKRSRLDHTRLMPVPVSPEDLPTIDHYLITHGHIDHFDPETVGPILRKDSNTKFYCPPACGSVIEEYFPQEKKRFVTLKSCGKYSLAPDIDLVALPAAHEELEKDEHGEYVYYSYLLLIHSGCKAVFFAGDTIPFAGQAELIKENMPDGYNLIMILPVNGRDAERAELGFKGNLNVEEAVDLCWSCQSSLLVPCHFGMFALNDIREPLRADYFRSSNCECIIPKVKEVIEL